MAQRQRWPRPNGIEVISEKRPALIAARKLARHLPIPAGTWGNGHAAYGPLLEPDCKAQARTGVSEATWNSMD
jgi:hypothetical protein